MEDFKFNTPQSSTPLQVWIVILDKHFSCRNRLEIFQPYVVMPDWVPPSTIIQSREQVQKIVEKIEGRRLPTIYTDGSGILGKIEASFVLSSRSKSRYLRTEKKYTVYSAELCRIYKALKIISNISINTPNQSPQIFHLFTDNQAAI